MRTERRGARVALIIGLGLVALLAAGAVTGLLTGAPADRWQSTGASIAADRGISESEVAADAMAPAAGGAQSGGEGSAAVVGSGAFSVPVIRTGSIDLEIADAADLAAAVDRVLASIPEGGYVERSQSGLERATLTLRVPAVHYDATLAAVRDLGRVVASTTDADDVSGEVVDLEARATILAAQRESLESLLASAKNVGEISSLRNQLFGVQEEIEQVNGRRQLLDRQIGLATLTVSVAVPGGMATSESGEPSTIAASWDRAVDAAATVIGGTIVVLGVLLPLGLVTAPLWGGWLLYRRRQAHRLLPTAAA